MIDVDHILIEFNNVIFAYKMENSWIELNIKQQWKTSHKPNYICMKDSEINERNLLISNSTFDSLITFNGCFHEITIVIRNIDR